MQRAYIASLLVVSMLFCGCAARSAITAPPSGPATITAAQRPATPEESPSWWAQHPVVKYGAITAGVVLVTVSVIVVVSVIGLIVLVLKGVS